MDNRENVINSVLLSMRELDPDQLSKLKDAMHIVLNDYEVTERCTDVAVSDAGYESALKKFIATKRLEGKSSKTIKLYSFYLTGMLHTLNKPVEEITTFDIRFYLASYQDERQASNRALENMRACISSFFSWLKAEDLIPSNPAESIKPIKYEKKTRQPFSSTEMELLRQACETKRDRALIEFLYATGCRISEAISLDRSDIDFHDRSVMVVGKGDKQRTVYLSDSALLYLSDYLESRTDNDLCLFRSSKPKSGDHRLTVSGAEYAIHQIGDRAGVSDVHPHRFRRTLATNLISRGAAIQDVSAILGHESIRTTQLYCTISQDDVRHTYHRCIA